MKIDKQIKNVEFFYDFSNQFMGGFNKEANFEKELREKSYILFTRRNRRNKIKKDMFNYGRLLQALANNIDEKW